MLKFPKQRLSYSEKSSNDFKWAKDTMNSILSYSPQNNGARSSTNSDYDRKLSNYKLYNNQLDQRDFERECNPLGLEVGQFKDSIQPYNKTYNKIQVLLGDELRRPFSFKAVLVNAEGIRSKLQHRDALLRNFIYSKLQETLQQVQSLYAPELVEQMSEEILPPEDIQKYMKFNYREQREILSEKILQYLIRRLHIKDKKNDAFKHGLISGEEILYVGTHEGNPYLEVINPLGAFYHKSPETKWIQDSLYAGFRTYMTNGEVLDRYAKYMTQEQINQLDTQPNTMGTVPNVPLTSTMTYGITDEDTIFNKMFTHDEGSHGPNTEADVLVQHVEWRSQKKIGFLTFPNEYGETQTEMVSEDFKVPTNATKEIVVKEFGQKCTYYIWEEGGIRFSLKWEWIPEVWTGTKIAGNIFCMIGPKQQQYRSMDDPYEVSLGYHGLIYNAMNANPVSLMDRMKPFQYLYFIVMHKLKRAIAQDQGKIFHFDVSMVDPKLGLEKTLYYLKEMNIDFYNPLMNGDMPGQNQRGKVSHTSDLSNMQNINNYINVLAAIDQQISDVAGVNRQREGQTGPTEAVSNAQANIQMSALITEIYFQGHNKLWEKALTSLIAATQQAWKGKSVVKQYVLDDMSLATLEMGSDGLQDCELGVFIADSGKEHEMFQALKGMADGLLNTNRATFSDLISLFEASTLAELKTEIQTSEKAANDREAQAQQSQQQSAEAMQQAQQAYEMEKQAREFEHEILIHQIDSYKFQKDQDSNDNGVPDPLEILKLRQEAGFKDRKLNLEEKKLEFDREKSKEELKIKRQKPSTK